MPGMTRAQALTLLASEIVDCDKRNKGREGVVSIVNGSQLWVTWHDGRRRHTWITLDRCHTDPRKESGYYLPALRELGAAPQPGGAP